MSGSLRRCAVWLRIAIASLATLGGAAACGGTYGGTPVAHPQPAAGDQANGSAMASGKGLEAAALPYQIVDGRTGKSVDEPAFWARLASARAVCIGEEHQNPHQHWLQLHAVRELGQRWPKGGKLALAMEMFQRPFQGALDDYAGHKIDAQTLRSRTGYADRWGYDYGFYGPTIDAAVAAGAQLLAANAARELTKKVVHHGLESLSPDERAQLPQQIKLDDAAHRAWFDDLMEDMGGSSAHSQHAPEAKPDDKPDGSAGKATKPDPKAAKPDPKAAKAEKPPLPAHAESDDESAEMPSADRIYTVQVIWDETMADTAAKWLAANPAGHLILLAGNGHCHDSAIINRMKRRGVADALSIRAVIDDGEGSVADALAKPINDYLVVLQMPPGVERGPANDDNDGESSK